MATSKPKPTNPRFEDLTGAAFSRLTVIEFHGTNKHHLALWLCKCDCGNTVVVSSANLKQGHTKSCGCLKIEVARYGTKHTIHGLKKAPEYQCWSGMIDRCKNKKNISHKRYGALGIRVCEFLNASVANLVESIGRRPVGMSIDRYPDNIGNYSCGQCDECKANGWSKNIRWATALQQGRNRRDNQSLEFEGVTLTVKEWAERTGFTHQCIRARLRRGWSVERSLTEQLGNGRHIKKVV